MSAISGFILGALVISIPWLFLLSWALSRLAEAERRNAAWQDECRHAAEIARRGYYVPSLEPDDDAAA